MADSPTVEMISLEALRQAARPLSAELRAAEWGSGTAYRFGLIRFEPGSSGGEKLIEHESQDLLCFVLAGRGSLKHGTELSTVQAGQIYKIPAGAPHDFSADGEPLELLYVLIELSDGGERGT